MNFSGRCGRRRGVAGESLHPGPDDDQGAVKGAGEGDLQDVMTLYRVFALALAVWREARGESPLGQLLVAQTIENRVTDARWPDTYVGVMTQPWQFSAFNAGDPNALLFPAETDAAWPGCVAVAQAVLDAPKPFTLSNHYHTTGVAPKWKDDTKIVAREGAHVFYRL